MRWWTMNILEERVELLPPKMGGLTVAAAALSVTRDPISDLKLCSMLLLSIALTVGGPNNVRMGLADGEARVLVAADWACPPEALVPPVEVPASLLGGTLADLYLAFAAAAALCLVSLYATWWELQGRKGSKLFMLPTPIPEGGGGPRGRDMGGPTAT